MKWKNQTGTRTYYAWRSMRYRCSLDSRNPNYKNYHQRGIGICHRWLNDYDAFFEDMGECPDKLSLDRINNDGNYEPANCRWASMEQQESNRRNNKIITFKNKTMTLSQWARELKINKTTLDRRLNIAKMPIELALSKKVKPHGTAYQYYVKGCKCIKCTKASKILNKKVVERKNNKIKRDKLKSDADSPKGKTATKIVVS